MLIFAFFSCLDFFHSSFPSCVRSKRRKGVITKERKNKHAAQFGISHPGENGAAIIKFRSVVRDAKFNVAMGKHVL